MAHAEKCPVCDGAGGFSEPNNDEEAALKRDQWTRWVECHGCAGKGWVEVSGYRPDLFVVDEVDYDRTTKVATTNYDGGYQPKAEPAEAKNPPSGGSNVCPKDDNPYYGPSGVEDLYE